LLKPFLSLNHVQSRSLPHGTGRLAFRIAFLLLLILLKCFKSVFGPSLSATSDLVACTPFNNSISQSWCFLPVLIRRARAWKRETVEARRPGWSTSRQHGVSSTTEVRCICVVSLGIGFCGFLWLVHLVILLFGVFCFESRALGSLWRKNLNGFNWKRPWLISRHPLGVRQWDMAPVAFWMGKSDKSFDTWITRLRFVLCTTV
jgi:hypothetical protein